MAWKLWPDPSDLMALAVLPVAWWLLVVQPRPVLSSVRRIFEPALLMIGALACLATSAPPSHTHYPFLANFSGAPQTVTMTWLLRRVNCPGHESVVEDPNLELSAVAATLNANDLDDPHQVTLGDRQRAALDAPPADDARMAETCPNRSVNRGWPIAECAVVLVSVDGGPTALVATPMSWTEYVDDSGCGSSTGTPCEVGGKGRKDTLALTLEDGTLELSPGSVMAMVPVSLAEIAARTPDPNGCRVQRDAMAEMLDENKSCEVDSDCCVATGGLPIPMDEVCSFYVRRDRPLIPYPDFSWRNQCFPGIRYKCDSYQSVQPAVCRNGRCGPTCLDVSAIPMCGSCPAGWTDGGSCKGSEQECLLNNGKRCACSSNVVHCTPAAPAVPGCPLICLREQPGCYPAASSRDAGAGDSQRDAEAATDR